MPWRWWSVTPGRIAELRAVVQPLTAGIVEHPRSHAEDYAEMLDEIERLTALVATSAASR